MRILSSEGRVIIVTLSRRNLLALLHKLDMPGSAHTIWRDDGEMLLVVVAQDDEEHYADREPPGLMHLDTEYFIVNSDDTPLH